ncbi:NAD(+) kinase [Campylobacter sp. VicNov18]|uniref:NAD(+) kinase n=1 Tax=Campylobacter bilis TaxID=2691918 RepID=UPI00130EFA7C|nr:NAD(+) kinase [Campylobacter bilis]MPV63438.1 NAD(+) kinase [Campylobacter hepaticus]MBM0636937.1 NAD(+) kinase [Campylobacter bilis]MCC8277649.1 NAD(+) kinase [Campylobacter bilis]MCC8299258.1 NAD(+) kinase [Campylobacter bilis]MCC8300558.1 NAD(+) kinase [Campylobacter bilis]
MQNKIDYKNIKKIGLVARTHSSLDKEILKLEAILNAYGVELVLFKESSKLLNLAKYTLDDLFKISDFIISLGGDGTLISLCRKACEYDKAVLGIHAGHLGFLTDFKVDEAENFFKAFFQGDFRIEKPYLLSVCLTNKQGEILEKLAFNDVVITKDNKASMAHIEVFRKAKKFNEYFGDGLIVATPAGSTAYNLSANGPIVYTLAQAFILTPVCSHSLTQRPIVLPKGFEIEIMAKDCLLCIDGQENYKMNDFINVKVGLSDKNVALIHPKNRDYFQILKEKLHWGN